MAFASRSRIVSLILTSAALSASLGCSVILSPRDDVQRCSNVDDCDEPEDERFEAICISDENADIDSTVVEQVCVAQFKSVTCDPMAFDADDVYRQAIEARGFSDYSCAESAGVRGCPPEAGVGCADGLEVNAVGTCDVPGADVPAINHNNSEWGDLEAQDVKDQFCRGFFCDDSYVCNSDTHTCQACDPELPFGQGGCGEVYSQGTLSCVYVSAEDQCDAPNSDPKDPILGDCVP